MSGTQQCDTECCSRESEGSVEYMDGTDTTLQGQFCEPCYRAFRKGMTSPLCENMEGVDV